MPSLPSSSPSVPSFSLSPSGVAAAVFFVVVLGGCGVYFVAVPFLRRKMEERRVKVIILRRCPIPLLSRTRFQRPRRLLLPPRSHGRAPDCLWTLKRSVVVVPSVRKSLAIAVPGPQLTRLVACNVGFPPRFGSSRIRSSPGPSPLRAVVLAHELACAEVPVFNPKQVSAAGYLVAARILLVITAKDVVISKAPFPEPAPAVAKAAGQHVEEPSIAHALAGLFASVYQDAEEDGDSSHFFDCSYDEEKDNDEEHPFKYDLDLGRAVPAPVLVSVTAPPSGIPIIIVESPSLVLGDRRLDRPSSRTRQRSNSFMDSLATRKRAPSSMTHQHGGSEGKKGDSRLLQVPKLLGSQDKDNENGRQQVPSRPHRARISP
ncbi:hypothetical protein B0H13DRAFT_2401759 [Mycena leptocephala]|nr:hypothetical protein B0H13DRAFT_2401759 [Mycena leptocephala]